MKYTVIIYENRRLAIEVDADSELKALENVTDDYCAGEIVCGENDITSLDFKLEAL